MASFIPRFLRQLRDVSISNPQDGDRLAYDDGTSTWINTSAGGIATHGSSHQEGGADEVTVTVGQMSSGAATDGQVATADGAGGVAWEDAAASGAPSDADYLVGTANGSLSGEIVVGTSPGGELGGTWASPTVDTTHSGSSHASIQAAAEATAASALSTHEADTTNVHGITDTSTLYRSGGTDVALADGGTGASLSDPNADRIVFWDDSGGTVTWLQTGSGLAITGTVVDFAADMATQAELDSHISDSSAAHAASAISADSTTLVGTGTDVQAVLEELDNGIADHLADSSDAHAASAISFSPTGNLSATDAQSAIAEAATDAASALSTHESDTTSVHGITDTSTLYRSGGTDVALADGGTGASLVDPNADRILFWDDSAGQITWLTPGTNLTITTTTIDAASSGGGATWSHYFLGMGA